MTWRNKIVIAAAGSGKTSYLVREALLIKDKNVLITTFTDSNSAEIRAKILDANKGVMPSNIFIMNWFSFLINHGVKPFQGSLIEFPVSGMLLTSSRSGLRSRNKGIPYYWGEGDFEKHYFTNDKRIYSDKLSKLAFRCNEKTDGSVIDRISRIFKHIFIDEVQDMAGYDLELISLLFKSPSRVLLVGDPRQVVYLTHNEAKHEKYSNGGILNYLKEKHPKKVPFDSDETTLSVSHRNNHAICELSSKLYPGLPPISSCNCIECRKNPPTDSGLFIVQPFDYKKYLEQYNPTQLRLNVKTKGIDHRFQAMNFGESKGLGFDRVIILPTDDMVEWLYNNEHTLKDGTCAKLYVALTRARHSVAIVTDLKSNKPPSGFTLFV